MAEPAAKKAKTEEGEKKAEEAKEPEKVEPPEPPKELEEDAPADKKPAIKDPVTFLVPDTTINVLPSTVGGLLMPLSEGVVQYLLAGARASVGVKAGRYMFEAKIIEFSNTEDGSKGGAKPKNLLRIGFTTAGSSPLVGETADGICFDSEGALVHEKKRTSAVCGRLARHVTAAVVLNLDASSPNANTISMFINGKRSCQPQPLPEGLKGKALFPTVAYRGVTVQTNFGPAPLAPLPFTCKMVAAAAAKEAAVASAPAPKDGKYEVVFPVGLPDEGPLEWVETFLEKHPGYVEISDRMILDWAEKSGLHMAGGELPAGIKRLLYSIATVQGRNFLVADVKGNLLKEPRAHTLAKFSGSFKKLAHVVVGEPPADFKKLSQERTLKLKQDQLDKQFRLKKLEENRKKMMAKKQKEVEKKKKQAVKELKKKQAEAKKKMEAEKKAKAAAEGKEGEKAEEPPEEKEEEEEEEEAEEESAAEEAAPEEPPPKAELTDEEKALWYVKKTPSDLSSKALSASFAKFSLPGKDEGFDEVTYHWSKGAKASEYLTKWILDKKLSTCCEQIQPSTWFISKFNAWTKAVNQWMSKNREYKAAVQKKAAAKIQKAKAEAAKAAKEAAKPKDGEEKKEGEAEKADEPMEEEEEEDEVDFEGIDIFGEEDACDIGGGMPLFKDFQNEDWAIMNLRFELHLLAHAFRHDVDDAERVGMTLDHLPFYYERYYKKSISPKMYGVESLADVVNLVKDTVYVTKDHKVLASQLDAEMESLQIFLKLTEEVRRERLLLIDMGEESAKLKINVAATASPAGAYKQKMDFGAGSGGKGAKWPHAPAAKGAGKFRAAPYAVRPVGPVGRGAGAVWGRYGKQ